MNFAVRHANLMRELARAKRPVEAPGLYINIHHRLCSDKIQSEVCESTTWKILEVLPPTKSGAKRCRCEERNYSTKKPMVCVLNADRFDWRVFTEDEVKKIENLVVAAWRESKKSKEKEQEVNAILELQKRKAEQLQRDHETASKILDNCTEDEQMKVSFSHLVLADLSWMYLDACQNMSINGRIEGQKKLSREVTELRKRYEDFLRTHVDDNMIGKIRDNSRQISDNDEFRKVSKEAWKALQWMFEHKYGKDKIPYLESKICATLGVMMIRSYHYAIKQSNKILQEKMSDLPYSEQSAANPLLDEVEDLLYKFQGEYRLKYDSGMRVFVERWNDVFSRVKFCVAN